MVKKIVNVCIVLLLVLSFLSAGEESLFQSKMAESPMAKSIFSFITKNREEIIREWIHLTEIPAPSGHEAKRAQYMEGEFRRAGLDKVFKDNSGNVIGIWQGTSGEKSIVISAHLDTVFQDVWEIKVRKEGNVLKAPGICDDTASLINLLWAIRALKQAGFQPAHTYYFIATVGEETGFVGMTEFMNSTEVKFDLVIALDDDLGKLHYGALGFGGGRITFRGPGAHTMQSRGVPNPNLAVALAVDRVSQIELTEKPLEKWTICNVGMIGGGKVRNAVSQESFFTFDLRSGDQFELERIKSKITRICQDVAKAVCVDVEINIDEEFKAHQLRGAKNSFLVKTILDILHFLEVQDIEADPLGSTEARVGIAKGILSANLGRTYGRYKHSLREEADIDGLFLAMKQVLLLIFCLN